VKVPDVDKDLPRNLPAEEAVIGSLLLDREAIIELAPFLQASDFYNEGHGEVYAAVLSLYERGEPADSVTLTAELERRGTLERVGGLSALTGLARRTPTASHVVYYARLVEKAATLRRLVSAGGAIAALGYAEPETADEVLVKAETLLAGVARRRGRRDFAPMDEVVGEWMDRMELLESADPGALAGIPSGYSDFDIVTGGWRRGQLVVLAARPGQGKTAILKNMALNMARAGHGVGIFSIEMGREELMEGWVSDMASVDSQKLRRGGLLTDAEWSRVSDAQGKLATLPMYVDDTAGISIGELCAKAHRLRATHQVDVLMVDYLQKVVNARRDGERRHEVGEVARRLKDLSRQLEVPVLAAAQLSREQDKRASHIPVLADLAESADIEREADIVLLLHRPELYEGRNTENQGKAVFYFAKHRGGQAGVPVTLRFEPRFTRFQPLSRMTDPFWSRYEDEEPVAS